MAVVGATGYTGAELIRLLLGHPQVQITGLVGHSSTGQPISELLPSLRGWIDMEVEPFDPHAIAKKADVAFCALPHGASAAHVVELRKQGLVVLDLSADFRLREQHTYESWYGAHPHPEYLEQAVYGLPELHSKAIAQSDLIAVPGCFPTGAILALAPLVSAGLINLQAPIIVDSKTGLSGAGRKARTAIHFPESDGGIRAYNPLDRHRHTAEMGQELGRIAKHAQVGGKTAGVDRLPLVFTPHLVPMTRGILSSVYAQLISQTGSDLPGDPVGKCVAAAQEFYKDFGQVAVHPSVVGKAPPCPDTLWVQGSNQIHISYAVEKAQAGNATGIVLAQSAIDNLVKGASGQAVQCLNLRFGWPQYTGLDRAPLWP